MTNSETAETTETAGHPDAAGTAGTPDAATRGPRPTVPVPAPGTDESAPPRTQEFGHDGAEHYPTEDDPA